MLLLQGGFITTSEISVTLTGQQNDAIYECRATNDELGITVIETINLKVLCKYSNCQPESTLQLSAGMLCRYTNCEAESSLYRCKLPNF